MKKVPALHSLHEDDPETKTEGATNDLRRTEQHPRCSVFKARSGPKREKRVGAISKQPVIARRPKADEAIQGSVERPAFPWIATPV
jgi:hypothetical protein